MSHEKEMRTLRNLIADYAYWQAELATVGSQPLEDREFIKHSAEDASKKLQEHFNCASGMNFRFPKDVLRSTK